MNRRWLPLVLVLGCATDKDAGSVFTGGTNTADDDGLSTEDANADGDGDGDGDSSGDGDEGGTLPKLDTLPSDTGVDDGVNGEGCEKADFLFVIDNSGSMADEQNQLIASFPEFISTIQDTLQAQDYHVMVVDTDASGGGSFSSMCINGVCTCTPSPACCESVCQFSTTCNGFDCDNLPGGDCDGTLGAGKIFDQMGVSCLPDDGPRFITDQDDLGAAFSCAGNVGTFGDGAEEPMTAMVEATGPVLGAVGACNEAFLRDDAILVVTVITDEEDFMKSPGTPPTWYQALVDAKGGNAEAIVVLGLIGDNDQPNAQCPPFDGDVGAEPSPNLRAFVELFGDRGIVGSVCAPNYGPFFVDAVSVIDVACDEFEPIG